MYAFTLYEGLGMLRRCSSVVIFVLFVASSLNACLWDRDTPQHEADDMPDVVAAIMGRFQRNPPLYYEMRLTRVAKHLQEHPNDLDSYDDAGVACDRLGRGQQAIAWMERKLKQIQSNDAENSSHLYRYHANTGTFIVHAWLRSGADRSQIEVVRAARDHIAKAIEINPQAHFGREAYQLLAMDWIIDPPYVRSEDHPNLLGWSFGDIYGDETEPSKADEAVRALAGLVVLGNAWESVDIFHALNVALQRDSLGFDRGRNGGRNTLAYFAWLRCRELIDNGKQSLYPDSPTGEQLKAKLPRPDFPSADLLLDTAFADARAEAESWNAKRVGFMNTRLKLGRHPDTDAHFWDGYVDLPAPPLPLISVPDAFHANINRRIRNFVLAIVAFFAMVGTVIVRTIYKMRRARTA